MFRFTIITIGKNKEKWLQEALLEYEKRLKGQAVFNWLFLKNEEALTKAALKEKSFILLDLDGKEFESQSFAFKLNQLLEIEKCQLVFVIGGDRGSPDSLKEKAHLKLKLSKLTFTHQICRLILVEQIYRALEILKGGSYHK